MFNPTRCCLIDSLAQLYAMALVATLVALSATEIIVYNGNIRLVTDQGFLLYLYIVSALFLCYVLGYVYTLHVKKTHSDKIVENHRVSKIKFHHEIGRH